MLNNKVALSSLLLSGVFLVSCSEKSEEPTAEVKSSSEAKSGSTSSSNTDPSSEVKVAINRIIPAYFTDAKISVKAHTNKDYTRYKFIAEVTCQEDLYASRGFGNSEVISEPLKKSGLFSSREITAIMRDASLFDRLCKKGEKIKLYGSVNEETHPDGSVEVKGADLRTRPENFGSQMRLPSNAVVVNTESGKKFVEKTIAKAKKQKAERIAKSQEIESALKKVFKKGVVRKGLYSHKKKPEKVSLEILEFDPELMKGKIKISSLAFENSYGVMNIRVTKQDVSEAPKWSINGGLESRKYSKKSSSFSISDFGYRLQRNGFSFQSEVSIKNGKLRIQTSDSPIYLDLE